MSLSTQQKIIKGFRVFGNFNIIPSHYFIYINKTLLFFVYSLSTMLLLKLQLNVTESSYSDYIILFLFINSVGEIAYHLTLFLLE